MRLLSEPMELPEVPHLMYSRWSEHSLELESSSTTLLWVTLAVLIATFVVREVLILRFAASRSADRGQIAQLRVLRRWG